MVVAKLCAIGAGILAFFGLLAFGPLYDNLWAQAGALALVLAWHIGRFSLGATWGVIKSALPFLATLGVFGALFQLVELQGRTDWLEDTLIKCLIFPSSLAFLRAALSYVTYLDLLALPVSIKWRFDLVTIKSAFQKGGQSLSRFSWYLDTYPYMDRGGLLKRWLAKYASLIVSLYLYLYHETENAYLLLENRYRHLQEEKQ